MTEQKANNQALYGVIIERSSTAGRFECIVQTRTGDFYGIRHKPEGKGFYLHHTVKFIPTEDLVWMLDRQVPIGRDANLINRPLLPHEAPLIQCQVVDQDGPTRTLHFGERQSRYSNQLRVPQKLWIGNLDRNSCPEPAIGTYLRISTYTTTLTGRSGITIEKAHVYHAEYDLDSWHKSISESRVSIAPAELFNHFTPHLCVGSFSEKFRGPIFNEFDYMEINRTKKRPLSTMNLASMVEHVKKKYHTAKKVADELYKLKRNPVTMAKCKRANDLLLQANKLEEGGINVLVNPLPWLNHFQDNRGG